MKKGGPIQKNEKIAYRGSQVYMWIILAAYLNEFMCVKFFMI